MMNDKNELKVEDLKKVRLVNDKIPEIVNSALQQFIEVCAMHELQAFACVVEPREVLEDGRYRGTPAWCSTLNTEDTFVLFKALVESYEKSITQ